MQLRSHKKLYRSSITQRKCLTRKFWRAGQGRCASPDQTVFSSVSCVQKVRTEKALTRGSLLRCGNNDKSKAHIKPSDGAGEENSYTLCGAQNSCIVWLAEGKSAVNSSALPSCSSSIRKPGDTVQPTRLKPFLLKGVAPNQDPP